MGFTVFCIFLVMQLMGYIDWSWWAVTAPLWFDAVLIVGALWFMVRSGKEHRAKMAKMRRDFGDIR
jgi:hypothetical protein